MASAYLTRTVTASTATSYTVSFWVKINDIGNTNTPYLWSIGSSAGNGIYFDSDAKIDFFKQSTSSYLTLYDGVLRDPSAWYHIVWSVNAGTGTAYVNGVTGNSHSSIPALNDNTGTKINIHSYVTGAYNTLDCCMAHFHFIDGTAYPASTFGETNSTSGIWVPKTAPSVTYGTNGFFLKFENSGSMGLDSSGNGNNFTVSGTLTQNVDTPSNVFATLNPLTRQASLLTLSNGNTTLTTPSSTEFNTATSTIGMSSGKYYFEVKRIAERGLVGITNVETAKLNTTSQYYNGDTDNSNDYGYYSDDGKVYNNGNPSGSGATWGNNDIVGCAVDLDNRKIYWHKNGTYINSGNPSAGSGGQAIPADLTYYFAVSGYTSTTFQCNFGNGFFGTTAVSSAGSNASNIGIFEYDVPTGYTALSTKGLNE